MRPAANARVTGLVISDHMCENNPVARHLGSDQRVAPDRAATATDGGIAVIDNQGGSDAR